MSPSVGIPKPRSMVWASASSRHRGPKCPRAQTSPDPRSFQHQPSHNSPLHWATPLSKFTGKLKKKVCPSYFFQDSSNCPLVPTKKGFLEKSLSSYTTLPQHLSYNLSFNPRQTTHTTNTGGCLSPLPPTFKVLFKFTIREACLLPHPNPP